MFTLQRFYTTANYQQKWVNIVNTDNPNFLKLHTDMIPHYAKNFYRIVRMNTKEVIEDFSNN